MGRVKIFLYGPPGSGKTTIGKMLARNLEVTFCDLDELIEKNSGMTVSEIFENEGESGFRFRESDTLRAVLAMREAVVALGGGTLLNPANRRAVEENGPVICLDSSPEILMNRLASHTIQRPLVDRDVIQLLPELLKKRDVHYRSFNWRESNNEASPEDLTWRIQIRLGIFFVRGMGCPYPVRVEINGANRIGEYMQEFGISDSVAVITDEHVAQYYLPMVLDSLAKSGYKTSFITIPAGEKAKSIRTLRHIWDEMVRYRFERGGTVLALGGGVVGDIAGFASATYMRGIDWAILPTTLLAMVDSSLGGKTGANLLQGKNLVGSFHPPRFVLSDPSILNSLPGIEMRNGLVEALKAGYIGDTEILKLCNQGRAGWKAHLDLIIKRAMAVKIKIIEEDPYESGYRSALNLGHTIGHAIEKASNYRMKHGFAVAWGLVMETELGEALGISERGLADEINDLFHHLNLITAMPKSIQPERLVDIMQLDKKVGQSILRFPLLVKPCQVKIGVEVTDLSLVQKVLEKTIDNDLNDKQE